MGCRGAGGLRRAGARSECGQRRRTQRASTPAEPPRSDSPPQPRSDEGEGRPGPCRPRAPAAAPRSPSCAPIARCPAAAGALGSLPDDSHGRGIDREPTGAAASRGARAGARRPRPLCLPSAGHRQVAKKRVRRRRRPVRTAVPVQSATLRADGRPRRAAKDHGERGPLARRRRLGRRRRKRWVPPHDAGHGGRAPGGRRGRPLPGGRARRRRRGGCRGRRRPPSRPRPHQPGQHVLSERDAAVPGARAGARGGAAGVRAARGARPPGAPRGRRCVRLSSLGRANRRGDPWRPARRAPRRPPPIRADRPRRRPRAAGRGGVLDPAPGRPARRAGGWGRGCRVPGRRPLWGRDARRPRVRRVGRNLRRRVVRAGPQVQHHGRRQPRDRGRGAGPGRGPGGAV